MKSHPPSIVRSSREAMFKDILRAVELRSTCTRRRVAALIVRDGRILSMGYNGSPAGLPHCIDEGCIVGPDGGCIRTQHAEMNAIAWAARSGIETDGSHMWVSCTPCINCAKLIINAGIRRVYALEEYRVRDGVDLLIQAKVDVLVWK